MITLLGTLRIYSLLDLSLLLVAAQTPAYLFIGSILLWISFLFFLENKHSHSYRQNSSILFWIIPLIIGLILYHNLGAVLFLLFSFLYSLKTEEYFGLFSPLFGAFNRYFLIAGISGFGSLLAITVLIVIFIRNLLGDVRDAKKDYTEGLKTIPVVLGQKRNFPYLHLAAVIATSTIWWNFTNLSILILIVVIFAEILTYNLTPRDLN